MSKFQAAMNKNIELAEKKVALYIENPYLLSDVDVQKLNISYISIIDGKVFFDENLVSVDKHNYKMINNLYQTSVNGSH